MPTPPSSGVALADLLTEEEESLSGAQATRKDLKVQSPRPCRGGGHITA